MRINAQGIKDNIAHIAGIIIGKTVLQAFDLRFDKRHRGQFWFSTVSANIAADEEQQAWLPFRMTR